MNKITKKMLTAILSVTFSLVALGTVTFAWITLTNTATLLPIDLNVSTYGGIEISLGNLDEMSNAFYGYFTDVKKANIVTFLKSKGYDVTDEKNFELKQVTYDGDNFYDMDGNEIEDNISGGYMTFDLTLRSRIANQYLYLTPNTSLTSERKLWKADAEFDNAHEKHIMPGDMIPYSLANTARMAFSSPNKYDDEKVKDFIYETPEFAMGRLYDEALGIEYMLYDGTFGNAVHHEGKLLNGGTLSYYSAKHSNDLETDDVKLHETNSTFLGANPIAYFNSNSKDDDGFYSVTVTVSIWLEGWDADSINAALDGTLTVNIQFTTEEPTGYREVIFLENENNNFEKYTVEKEKFAKSNETVYMKDVSSLFPNYEVISSKTSGVVTPENDLVLFQRLRRLMYQITLIPNYTEEEIENDLRVDFLPIVLKHGLPISEPNAKPKNGYRFAWFEDEDYETEFIFDLMPAKDMKLYGKYVPEIYTITFNTNGGDEIKPLLIGYEKEIYMPEDPKLVGYKFLGWYEDSNLNTVFENPKSMPNRNIVLYAKWEIIKSYLIFETNGGITMESVQYVYGENITPPNEPTKDGFIFMGWYLDKELTNPFEFFVMPDTDVTIYAKWDSFTITFDSMDGSVVEPIIQKHGTTVTPPMNPTKEGFIFSGWYTNPEFEGEIFDFTKLYDVTLYAKWEEQIDD